MTHDPDDDLPADAEGFPTAIDPIIPSQSSLDQDVTPRDPIPAGPHVDETPLDVIDRTPVDPFDVIEQTPVDPFAGPLPDPAVTDPDSTNPGLLSGAGPPLDESPPSPFEHEATVKEEPIFSGGDPTDVSGPVEAAAEPTAQRATPEEPEAPEPTEDEASREVVEPRDTDEDLPYSRGPLESEVDITAPTVKGGERDLKTPVNIHVDAGTASLGGDEPVLERTEIVGRGGAEETLITRPPPGPSGWFVALAVLVVSAVAVAGLYFGVVQPLQAENQALVEQLEIARARELELQGRLESVNASKSQLEAATESLNRQVEEREGELEAALRQDEEEDAQRRREPEAKGADKKKGKKKRKKKRK